MNGNSLITIDGINALANASAMGTSIKPKYFKFSNQDLVLNPNLNANDLIGWITQDINLYQKFDNKTIEFVCDVVPSDATDYTKSVGLFLEDGTLFMVAKPPFAFPPSLRQTMKIQMIYDNANELLDFKYLPYSWEEQSLMMIDISVTLGLVVIDNAKEIGLVKQKIGVR